MQLAASVSSLRHCVNESSMLVLAAHSSIYGSFWLIKDWDLGFQSHLSNPSLFHSLAQQDLFSLEKQLKKLQVNELPNKMNISLNHLEFSLNWSNNYLNAFRFHSIFECNLGQKCNIWFLIWQMPMKHSQTDQ